MKKLLQSNIVLALVLFAFAAIGAEAILVKSPGLISITPSGSSYVDGEVIDLGTRYGIALTDIADGATGAVRVEGIYEFQLATNQTISVGDLLYWDDAGGEVTETVTAGTYIGLSVQAVTTTTATSRVSVELNIDGAQAGGASAVITNATDLDITVVNGRVTSITSN